MDGEDLILDLLKETRESVRKIEACIVGRDNCKELMDSQDKRLRKVELACAAYDAIHPVDGEQLLIAKDEAIKTAQVGMNDLDIRLRSIESKMMILDLTWSTVQNNPVLLTAFLGGAAILVGVVVGRVLELTQMFGTHSVAVGLGITLIAMISAWISRRKVKKTLQSAGLIHALIIVTILISPCLADDIKIGDDHPMIVPFDQVNKAANVIETYYLGGDWQAAIDEEAWWTGAYMFAGNNSTNETMFQPDRIVEIA
jgi:hypothetical protein